MLTRDMLSAMTPEQLRAMRAKKAAGVEAIPALPRDGGPLPTSFAQQRLWFMAQGPTDAYPISRATVLEGSLDHQTLRWVLRRLVARHESLRTAFHAIDGEPVQSIEAEVDFDLAFDDLSGREDADVALARIQREEARAPFDLGRAPLLRARLVRMAEARHVLLLTVHHIVFDGWSMAVFARELAQLYVARVAGGDDPLPMPELQYADYAAWQRAQQGGDRAQRAAAYWREALRGAPALLELPYDRPRPQRQEFRGDWMQVRIDASLAGDIRTLARRHGVTVYMLMLSAWSALLSRLSGQHDIVVGTPVANRDRVELQSMIGFFVNMLAIRLQIDPGLTTEALLARAREAVLAAQEHQELPFEQVVEQVNPARSLAYTPLFQTAFAWQNNESGDLHLPGLVTTSLVQPHMVSKYDLMLSLGESVDGGFEGEIEYADALFSAETVRRWFDHLQRLLRGMADAPDLPVARLPILGDDERDRQLDAWNHSEQAWTPGLLQAGIEAQARRTPDAVALVHDDSVLHYRDLDARANRLAHRLRVLGVRPDARVGIAMPRCADLVVAMLAVLKAGGAYVPLDPAYPPDRLADILDDAAPVALLACGAGHDALARVAELRAAALPQRVDPVTDAGALAGLPDTPPDAADVGLRPDHLAYLIYTSGSTGRPKGVAIEHRQASNFIQWALRAFDADELRNVLFSTSINFDLSIFECFAPLSAGGRITLVENALALLDVAPDISLINTVPSAIAELVEAGAIPPGVRTINLAGEALKRPLGERLLALPHLQRLCNLYGPSETTTYSTWVAMRPAEGFVTHIGGPIANTRLYILDAFRQPLPTGAVGELYIGGEGVARGYLDRPELTAERFLDDPFASAQPGAPAPRMYRTGDLARWRPDGTVEYLGRNDFQVKIRGFRIEPGEIEARLAACPGVREATVLARDDGQGTLRLVAYCLADAALDTVALRESLARQLPAHMVPTAFVVIERWPLTPNGKLDRGALPAPAGEAATAPERVPPRTALEREMAALWCEVLGLPEVGVRDDFFALGGHSLLGVRLIARIRARLGLEPGRNALFSTPTIEALLASLDIGDDHRNDTDMTSAREHLSRLTPEQLRALRRKAQAIPSLPRDGRNFPASFAQQRLWFLSRMTGSVDAYLIPQATELNGVLDIDALRWALDRLVARHESLRTGFEAVDGAPCQRIDPPSPFDLPLDDLSALSEDEARAHLDARLAETASAPFDLARGPLLRGRLVRLAPQRHILLLTAHHIVSDGWSMGVIARELETLYAARLRGGDDPLPPLPLQYADYAVWQRERLSGERLAQEGAWWRETLAGAPELLELPTDRPRPAEQDFRGDWLPLRIEPALVAQLKATATARGMTLYMPLMAAWALLMARWSGQHDVVVGTPVANRGRGEIQDLIGFFVNMLAVRIGIEDGPSVADLLDQVRTAVLAAQEHQDLPFEQVVEQVNPARSLAYAPLFQTVFAWQNNDSGELRLQGLDVTSVALPHGVSKFDLLLSLGESADGGVEGVIEYASALFDRKTVVRLARCFEQLLVGMVADLSSAVDRLPMLGVEEYRRVTEAFNDTARDFGPWRPVHACFEAHAVASPDAQALTCGDTELRYGELNARANRLAHWLRAQGVVAESLVAVCMRRSAFAIEAVLGVMKSGGAYVPVDPAYPQDRVAEMLGDAQPAWVLTDAASRDTVAQALATAGVQTRLIAVDDDRDAWSGLPATDLPIDAVGVTEDSLAYVIYTSGSTGKPKGVASRHGGPSALMHALREPFELSADTRVLQFASFSFDAFVLEWVMAYGFGGSLHLGAPDELLLGDALEALVARRRITHCFLTPTLLSSLPDTARLETMRLLTCGGEAVPVSVFQRWQGGRAFYNVYGPTETTALSIVQRCSPALAEGDRLPIGKPLANERVYILDRHRQPVPIGVTGELFIGGAGVARGYLHRPELTAERFIDSPFVAGDRLYRTGDLGRWREDGLIDYLGRNDFQVKIRGYRIELGEIESRLAALPGVKEAVVRALPGADGVPRLVAYVEAAEGVAIDADALRHGLHAQLPDYMVPTVYMPVVAWPSTRNGKLDRAALPVPDADALGGRVEYVAPSSPMEEVLAGIWGELLGIERIGVHDNFFDLGGHSLMAMRLLAAVQDLFGFTLPLRVFFESPTIARMARALLPDEALA